MTDAPLATQRGSISERQALDANLRKQRSADTINAIENGETLVAGAIAGLIAELTLHPLDTASLRAKVHPGSAYAGVIGSFRVIWQQEGLRGFYAGVSATMMTSLPSNAVYFTVYEASKNSLNDLTGHAAPSAVYFLSGAMSEVAASLLVAPMEVVKARLQLGANPARATGGLVASTVNYSSVPRALGGIYRERGLRGLVAGWNAGLVMDMCFSATQFLLYETLKARMAEAKAARATQQQQQQQQGQGLQGELRLEGGSGSHASPACHAPSALHQPSSSPLQQLSTAETLGAGCVAGGIAAIITNPLDVITSRLMIQAGGSAYGGGMLDVARRTLNEGPVGLWRGTLPRAAQLAPMSALAFTVYEAVRAHLRLGAPGEGGGSGGEGGSAGTGHSGHDRPHIRHAGADMPQAQLSDRASMIAIVPQSWRTPAVAVQRQIGRNNGQASPAALERNQPDSDYSARGAFGPRDRPAGNSSFVSATGGFGALLDTFMDAARATSAVWGL